MKKNNLTKCVFSALLLASAIVSADEKYPAADFQPEVVFQDKEYISNNAHATKAPVSKASTPADKSAGNSEVDAKYPAADFKPQVVYTDADYKPGKTADRASETSGSGEAVSADSEKTEVKTGNSNFLIGLIALGAVGFFFFKRQTKPEAATAKKTTRAHVAVASTGLTGVSKYVNKISGTGVSRYVAKNAIASKVKKTGVANYLARQKATKATTSAAATGVERYMRDRG